MTTRENGQTNLVRRIMRNRLAHNVFSLYGMQIASYLFPVLTIPYLTRVLGVFHWGLVAFAQALGSYVGLAVEFGFGLSSTREVACERTDQKRLSEILAGVLGAKLVIALAVMLLIFLLTHWIKQLKDYPILLWAGALAGIAQGFSMAWFYQGLERMHISSTVDVLSKAAGTFGVFLFVHVPAQASRVLVIQAVASIIGAAVLLLMAYREVPFCWPSLSGTWVTLRKGASMFLLRSAAGLYTSGNALILGIFAPINSVAYYSGAEKIVRALVGLLLPISQGMYPRINYLLRRSPGKAILLVRLSAAAMFAGSVAMMLALWFMAPVIIRIALGPGFSAAVPVIKVLSLLLPAVALSNVFGIQWMVPLRMDRSLNTIIVSCGILNLGTAAFLAHHFAHIGVAYSVTGCECAITIAVFAVLYRRRLNPLTRTVQLLREVRQLQLQRRLEEA